MRTKYSSNGQSYGQLSGHSQGRAILEFHFFLPLYVPSPHPLKITNISFDSGVALLKLVTITRADIEEFLVNEALGRGSPSHHRGDCCKACWCLFCTHHLEL